eukprot:TRINITY_DN921_c0_g2_i1.p1 TRINITY_DN921_c0_g2~~TRINITY_DN921_c0_g2_i1.p1  ORF type:complete len:493 (-),score=109.87 TRINITY_DN921_c0_g2_i1:505-1983(-)
MSETHQKGLTDKLIPTRKNSSLESLEMRNGQPNGEETNGLLKSVNHPPFWVEDGSKCRRINYVPRRYILLAMSFLGVLINYTDRTNISVAVMSMASELGWSESHKGFVLSAFYLGYFFSGIPGGYISDKIGGKRVLLVAAILWSLFTVLTPWAARSSYGGLITIRILLGLAEGLAWPSIHSLMGSWFPAFELSSAVAIFTSGSYFGTVFTVLAAPPFISHYGWPSVFYIFGFIGFFYAALWWWIVYDTPTTHPTIHPDEVSYIESYRSVPTSTLSSGYIPWKALLTSKQVWAFFINMFASGWGFFVLLSWMPDYFQEEFKVDLNEVGYYTVMPYVFQGIVAAASGTISSYLVTRFNFSLLATCSIMQLVGLVGPSIFLTLLGFTHTSPVTAAVYLTLALSINATTCAGVSVYHLYIVPQYAGLVFAMGNSWAVLPGVIGVATAGSILDAYHSWTLVFLLAIISYLLGAVVWVVFARGEVQGLEAPNHISAAV